MHIETSTDRHLLFEQDLYSSLTKAPTNFFDPEANRPLILILRDQFCQQDLLLHTSKEIRAMLACCIAEFLRLTAPDMPFDNDMAEVSDFHSCFRRKELTLGMCS